MTGLSLVLFALVIVMGACLAWWLASRVKETSALPNSRTLEAEAARLERYRIMTRLFSHDDHDFIASSADVFAPIAQERLLKSRRRILRLYLSEVRGDFSRFWSLCRLLAPYAPDPDFGAMLLGQLVMFHITLSLVWLRTFGPSFSLEESQFSVLVDAVQELRSSAQLAVEGAERMAFDAPAA